MRFAILLTGAALAAAPALSQTTTSPGTAPQTTPAIPAPGATPSTAPATPDTGAAPATPAGTASTGTATAGTAPTAATPDASATVVNPAVGVTVLDPTGVPVGKIKSIDSQYVTLATDKGEARLPVAGVGPGRGGAAVGLTKAQIDAAVVQAKAAEPAAGKAKTAAKKR